MSLFCALDELSLVSRDVVFDVYFTSFCFTLLCLSSVICTFAYLGFFPMFEALLERSLALYFRHWKLMREGQLFPPLLGRVRCTGVEAAVSQKSSGCHDL